MQDTVTCPSCRVRLRLPTEMPAAGMTCPRCLARVPYPTVPQTGIQATPVPPPPHGEGTPEPLPAGRTRCPSCGKATEPVWVFCPYCEEPLREEQPSRAGGIDRDIRRDSAGTKIALGLMTVLGGISTFWYFAAALAGPRDPDMIVGGILGLLFMVLVSTGIMFYRTRKNPSERGFGRVVLGTFTLIGVCISSGCSLMLAVFVFLFVVCLAGGRW